MNPLPTLRDCLPDPFRRADRAGAATGGLAIAAMIAGTMAACPTPARADDAVAPADPGVAAPRLHLSSERRPGTTAGAADRRETVLWAGSGQGLAMGVGVAHDDAPRAVAAAAVPPRMIVGLALDTGERSALTVESSWRAPTADAAAPAPFVRSLRADAPQVRVGWQLRSADRASAFKGGALRFELGSQTALLVKPRVGRVGMLLTSRW